MLKLKKIKLDLLNIPFESYKSASKNISLL